MNVRSEQAKQLLTYLSRFPHSFIPPFPPDVSERFFIDEPISGGAGDEIVLGGPEAHHLVNVRRARPGQEVVLFDGTGREFTAVVVECGRREARLQVATSQTVSREPAIEVVLGVALPKGDRQRWLVEKAVELGAGSLVPLSTERGVAQPTASALGRLRRVVLEATKQCGRTRLMEVREPLNCREYFDAVRADPGCLRICAHPYGEATLARPPFAGGRVMLAIGPEGGFTEDEIRLAREAGWTIASLGPRILRVETAAVALAALFTLNSYHQNDAI